MTRNNLLFGALSSLALFLTACPESVKPPAKGIDKVTFNPTSATVDVGAKVDLGVTVTRLSGDTTTSTAFTCTTTAGTGSVTVTKTVTGCSVTGVTAGTATVTATSTADAKKTATATVTVNAPVTPATTVYQLNAGNGAVGEFVADDSTTFSCSKGTSGGKATVTATINVAGVANAAPAEVYQSDHFCGGGSDNMTFMTPASLTLDATATYTVRLHFSENYLGTAGAPPAAANTRVFDISVNGASVDSAFDIFTQAGGATNKAVVKDYPGIAPASGKISVTFTAIAGKGDPTVNGIEIIKQ